MGKGAFVNQHQQLLPRFDPASLRVLGGGSTKVGQKALSAFL